MTEIIYSINPQATLDEGCLVIDLLEGSKKDFCFEILPKTSERNFSQWSLLTVSAFDKEALAFLLKEELSYQIKCLKNDATLIKRKPLRQIHISSAQASLAIELITPTQKLFCKGKQLVVDSFDLAEFYYSGSLLENADLQVSGYLRWGNKEVPLNECEAIIPGEMHWFIHKITLKRIKTLIRWKKFIEIWKNSPLILQGMTKQAFLEQLDPNDSESPQLIMREGTLKDVTHQPMPYPLLKLTDRWGAFANLWMDYHNGYVLLFSDRSLPHSPIKEQGLLKRQTKEECSWENDLLETDFIKKIVGDSTYYCPLDKVAKTLTFLLELGWKIQDYQGRNVLKESGLEIKFEDFSDTIIIKGKLNYENYEADITNVLGAFNRRDQFIQLSSDSVGLLPLGRIQESLQDLSDEAELVGGEIRIKKACFATLGSLWEETKPPIGLTALKNAWQTFSGIQHAPPSELFLGKLRPYQQEGVNWLSFLEEYGFHGILADEMGLGKTVQILAFLSRLPKGKPHLIVLPTSLLFNWHNEIQRFLPSFKVILHQGEHRIASETFLEEADIILTSYATMRIDLYFLQKIHFNCLILDEAQMIKNAETQTSQAACKLVAQLRLSVTGTPVENHLSELWSHFHFLNPDLFGSQQSFHAELIAGQSDSRYLSRIKKKIAPFFLRRRKLEVASDLPLRIDQVVWIEMGEEQRHFYEGLLLRFRTGLLKKVEVDGVGKHRMEVLEAILRLRQACCHPLLLSSLINENIPASAKFDALLEDLQTIVDEGNKVLVYSQFTSMLKIMTKAAKERKWNFGYLDGNTIDREEEVLKFQNDPSCSLFFISLKAGGVGLNLTAADYVYLYDPWWNEAVEEQAINRAHRIGRQDRVIAKRFVIRETVEEKIMKLKASKRLIVNELLDFDTTSSSLNLEDLQYLLS